MTDIQYWDDTLTEEIEAIQAMVDKIPSIQTPMEKTAALDRAKARIKSATGTKRSFKMEVRLVQDVRQRRQCEARLAELDQQLKTLDSDIKAIETEMTRGELFVQGGGGSRDPDGSYNNNAQDGVRAGDDLLREAGTLQDKTQDSLANTRQMIAASKEVGVSTLEELERQRGVIDSIGNEIDRLDDNLARAEVLLKQFGKRIATDQFIQCFALLNCLLLCGVVIYAIINKGGLPGSDSGSPTNPVTAGTTTGGRLLLDAATRNFLRRP